MANFTQFTNFSIFCHQSISFLEKSQKFLFTGYTLANFLSFSTFSNWFTLKRLKMTHNCKFCRFSIFSPKMRLRLTQNGQFHLIHNFFHLLPPKHLIFREISKIFVPGAGYISKLFEFFNFFESF